VVGIMTRSVDSDHNTVAGDTASQNRSGFVGGGDGILVDANGSGSIISGNVAKFNTDDGIDVESGRTTLTGNTANRNDDLGIEAVKGVTASGNHASGNGNPAQCVNVSCG
jgi:parallel beta-helix repeat protein